MKLHLADNAGLNIFTAYGDDHVAVNNTRHNGNVIVLPAQIVAGWSLSPPDLMTEADAQTLIALGVEIVLLGTGKRLRFPNTALLRRFREARVGFEVMDLPAACRTYNILAAEGRNVAAALLFDDLAG